jgi:hypothetical protein
MADAACDKKSLKSRTPSWEEFFLHYGAGAHLLAPIARWRYWNRFCWIVIAFGILGWIAALWLLRSYTE